MSNKELIDLIERFKVCLISKATDGDMDDSVYQNTRKIIISIPQLNELVPSFIKSAYTANEFRKLMQGKFKHWCERETFITEEMNKMIVFLESDVDAPNVVPKECDIFISHCSKDKELANILIKFLVSVGVDKKKIFFTSNISMGVDSSIRQDIRSALKGAKYYLIIATDNYFSSEYCLNEEGAIWYISDNYSFFAPSWFSRTKLKGFITDDNILRHFDSVQDYLKVYGLFAPKIGISIPDSKVVEAANNSSIEYLEMFLSKIEELTQNESKIILLLKRNGLLTVSEICDKTGLTAPLVFKIIESLVGKGFVKKDIAGTGRIIRYKTTDFDY